jgi:hypothetical protein
MSDQTADYAPLSAEQLAALNDVQKDIFLKLDPADRQFFAGNFSPASLGKALERKWETVKSRATLAAHDQRLRDSLQARGGEAAAKPGLSAGDVAAGAAGVAGLVGIGVLARQIAPQGKAAWRGVTPRDLVDPLVREFARQEKTDIRFQQPDAAGSLHGEVLLRTPGGMSPALNVTLTPLAEATQVEIGKVSSESVLETVKESGQKLFDLVQDGLRLGKRQAGAEDLLDLAGKVMDGGAGMARTVKDLDVEDRAWEVVRRAADPLQTVYDEKMKGERDRRLALEMAWDDYLTCPKCRVAFAEGDGECRVCATARPPEPEQPDPRRV